LSSCLSKRKTKLIYENSRGRRHSKKAKEGPKGKAEKTWYTNQEILGSLPSKKQETGGGVKEFQEEGQFAVGAGKSF